MSNVSHRGTSSTGLPPTSSVQALLDAETAARIAGDTANTALSTALDTRVDALEAGGGGGAGTTYTLVTSYGVSANSASDQRALIQAAIDSAVAAGIRRLHFPKGTYLVGRTTLSGTGICLLFSGISNLEITGDGPDSTIIKMDIDFSTTVTLGRRMLYFKDSSLITFRDLTLSGGWTNATFGHDEQIHLTEINSTNAESKDIQFNNVWFKDCFGDGFRTVGKDIAQFSADAATDVVTHWNALHSLATAHGLVTGDGPYYITSTGTLPGGLKENTPHYFIRINSTTGKWASSYANALAGTAIDITSAGTDYVWTVAMYVQRCVVHRCKFINVKRAPVSGQRASRACKVGWSYIESVTDSAIDFEPSGTIPDQWDISHNTIVHNAPAVDFAVSFLAARSTFAFNQVLGGAVDVKYAIGSRVIGNYIRSRDDASGTLSTLRVSLGQDVVIAHNTVVRPRNAVAATVLLMGTDSSLGNDGVSVFGNTFEQYTVGDVIQVSSSANCIIERNTIRSYNATPGRGVFGTSTILAVPLENLKVNHNIFAGSAGGGAFTYAVFINSNAGTVGNTEVTHNSGVGLTKGLGLAGGLFVPGFTVQPLVHDNTWTTATPIELVATIGLEAVKTRKTPNRTTFEGAGSPESVVTASIGDTYYRNDGAAGTLVYQKDTGTATKTGWVAKW